MISKTIAISLIFCGSLCAEPLSQHNEPHAGIQAGIDRLASDGCTRFQITRSGQYILHSTQDPNAYDLTGNTITVRCVRPAAEVSIIDLYWQAPTNREQNIPLKPEHIAGYQILYNGEIIDTTNTRHTINDPDCPCFFSVRALDIDGQASQWSPELRL